MAPEITFSRGVEFSLQGPYRIETRDGGLCIVGHGMLLPIETREQGEELIARYAPKEERCPN